MLGVHALLWDRETQAALTDFAPNWPLVLGSDKGGNAPPNCCWHSHPGQIPEGTGSLKGREQCAETFQPDGGLDGKTTFKGHLGASKSPVQWITASVNKAALSPSNC